MNTVKSLLILLSVFLFVGCESDFDKCMNARMPQVYEEIVRVDEMAPASVRQSLSEFNERTGNTAEKRAEKMAGRLCNDQGFYE